MEAQTAVVAGRPGVRFWGDEVPRDFIAEVKRRLPSMPQLAQGAGRGQSGRPVVDILALSGGGGDGAFGAGVLAGWTKSGRRPEFEVVTGVSAGAIIAPFAYLGPKYDHALEEIWTRYQTSQIATAQILPGLLGGSALTDSTPLQHLIAKYVTRSFLREIAREYRRGRMLLVGTTNLDAQRQVVWNMGEIAANGGSHSVELFRKVILASASIPGALPPVNIDVQVANGQPFTEMHVDGGTTRELFVSPVNVPFATFDRFYDRKPIRRLYIIKNGKVAPEQEIVEPSTIQIAARAISTLIKNQSLGEAYRIYRMAKDDGAQFNFLAIPADFKKKANQFFDPEYQRALFDEGRRIGRNGGPWLKQPPDLAQR
ncbi:MAG: patatin-like phospholipase family protein [Pseudomonadota bacterium]